MSQLSDYIKTQLANGFSKEQIEKVLSQQGYNQEQISRAFSESHQGEKQSFDSSQQFQQLYTYVKNTLAGGYPPKQLYSYLVQQGYEKKLLDAVFVRLHNREHTLLPQSVKHQHEVSSSSITKVGIMLVVLLLIGVGLFFLINSLAGGEDKIQLFELEINLKETILLPGDTLEMDISTVNEGDLGLIETQYKFIISDSQDRIVNQWEKAGGTQTRRDFFEKEILPDDIETGLYKISVIAYYGSKSSRASRSFKIVESEEEQKNTDELVQEDQTAINETQSGTGDETGDGTGDETGDGQTSSNAGFPEKNTIPDVEIEKPSSSSKRDTDDDLLSKATRADSSAEAAGFCSVMENPTMIAHCYTYVSETYSDYNYCSKISKQESREDCYITFLLLGDNEICEFVNLTQNIALCNEFSNLNYFQEFYETGNEDYLDEIEGMNPEDYLDPNYDPENPPNASIDDLSITNLV